MEGLLIPIIIGVIGWLFKIKSNNDDHGQKHKNKARNSKTLPQSKEKSGRMGTERGRGPRESSRSASKKAREDYYQKKSQADPHMRIAGKNEEVKTHHEDVHYESKRTDEEILSKKDILNGIIMAEVLGPPRAKKPFRK
ncbi:hypothetical protein [Falsibacillus albus]|uniref:Uncharacterized protein n=1 Tax=Falsibacillus albus TaxID=2478915 RepID=A0A3L7K577_9BACI|nr:hypothetical protein [Falsibacillus albus]RLQ98178.1 hypothetical protein D9X91_01970 [Falsibacillus albus]